MNLQNLNYHAYDIDQSDIDFLNNYFNVMKQKGLNGKAEVFSLIKLWENPELLKKIPNSDIIFLFKVLDILDQSQGDHKFSEDIIQLLMQKTKFIVASFATKTITRKPMNFPNRKWFELMLNRIKLKFTTINLENEIFYIISK